MASNLIQELWKIKNFTPNDEQRKAILFDENKPMFITAAPGSGKTRVLLWRTVYLIVDKKISPDQIFLSTFTEKAAHQLKEGLKELLGIAANFTNEKYDLARMYVGTIHSNCHRVLLDRKFSVSSERQVPPRVLDELGQYLYIYNQRFWSAMLESVGLENSPDTYRMINAYLGTAQQVRSGSRHTAAVNMISLFNRLSEELVDPTELNSDNELLDQLYKMYIFYLDSLKSSQVLHTDLSLLQADALRLVEESTNNHFQHVIPKFMIRFQLVSQLCQNTREAKNLTIKQVAMRLKVPQYRIKDIEAASVEKIVSDVLEKYVDLLDLKDFFTGWAEKNKDIYQYIKSGKRK